MVKATGELEKREGGMESDEKKKEGSEKLNFFFECQRPTCD